MKLPSPQCPGYLRGSVNIQSGAYKSSPITNSTLTVSNGASLLTKFTWGTLYYFICLPHDLMVMLKRNRWELTPMAVCRLSMPPFAHHIPLPQRIRIYHRTGYFLDSRQQFTLHFNHNCLPSPFFHTFGTLEPKCRKWLKFILPFTLITLIHSTSSCYSSSMGSSHDIMTCPFCTQLAHPYRLSC